MISILEVIAAGWLIGIVFFLFRVIQEAPKQGSSIGALHVMVAVIWPFWGLWYLWVLFSEWRQTRNYRSTES